MSDIGTSMNWDLTVTSKRKLLDLKLRELVHYRDLILMFFIRDFTVIYKQTILGPLWHILSPLLATIIYAFVFGNILGIGTDGIPALLFFYGGNMLWTYFSTCLNNGSVMFRANAGIFGKVYFPRLTVPIATTLSAISKMLIQFFILMVFLVFYIRSGYDVRPTPFALLFPVMIIWLGAIGMGFGMIFSALTTKYRDLNSVMALILQLAKYITPVIYPLSQVPEEIRFLFYINPVSAPMELFRVWFYGAGHVPPLMIIISVAMTILVLFLGLILFTRTERTCMDVI